MASTSSPTSVRLAVSVPSAHLTPSFYRTNPPPHWSNVDTPNTQAEQLDVSKRIFKSPWPSSQDQSMLGFFRARFTDWNEVPLPPKQATQQGGDVLPTVLKPTWTGNKAVDSSLPTNPAIVFTWLGHASVHLQIPIGTAKTITVLCDPVLSQRCSPFQWLGPSRYTESPTSVEEIIHATIQAGHKAWPDIVVLSHNHYDHLDYNTMAKLLAPPASTGLKPPHVFCTLGNKSWFQSNFGLADANVTECDWWQQAVVTLDQTESLRLTCVPAQHFSGRGLHDRNRTLWAGWTFEALPSDSSQAKIYFAGDTGYRTVSRNTPKDQEDNLPSCPAFREIGDLLGPFDLSLIPIGAYLPRWFMSTVHLAPQDSVLVHRDVKSKLSYGIHWGSFRLTPEDVNEPPRLLVEEAKRIGLDPTEFGTIRIGESVLVSVRRGPTEPSVNAVESEEALPESKLGTKAHWDGVYEREVNTFQEIGEEGEVWFGEDAVMRMIRYLEQQYANEDVAASRDEENSSAPTILDLGTGNGHLLFEMLESSAALEDVLASNKMVGIDYSDASIQLARSIGEKRGGDCENVKFLSADLMDSAQVERLWQMPQSALESLEGGWDLVCDKGTMDAIALSSELIDGETPVQLYTHAVNRLVKVPKEGKQGGIFLITSCNFTEEELVARFTNAGFQVDTIIPTPSFTFGGAKGSSTTSIAFRRT